MGLRKAVPFKFKPRGTTDTWDGMNSAPGAMTSLQNLIPDISTPFAFQCRPGMQVISTFPGFDSPGSVSWAIQLNGYVYGLIASSRNSGFDEPFVYNIATNTFLTVAGITASNVPTTQATTGDWTPPSAAVNGPYIVFTHPGFNTTNGYFGYFDVSGFSETSTLGDTTNGSPTIKGFFPVAGIMPGYKISGSGIPAGTTVLNYANVSNNTTGNTNSSTSLTGVAAPIPVGSQVTGTGIPTGTSVTAISGSAGNYTVTISQSATATATGIEIFYTGTTITMSANATATANAVSITVSGGTQSAPLWASGNTTGYGLTAVPTAVNLFYNRLYFAVDSQLEYTDTLSLNRTSGAQELTLGDSSPITALSLFTLTTTSQGILQGLLAFKASTIFQITGDAALSNLAVNSLNTAAGTIAPNSVTPTPNGVFFMANDGIRIVQIDGTVSEPDSDLRTPFVDALYPSRVNASYNSDVYRICTQNSYAAGTPWQEYWYDIGRQIWTGPHTCQQDVAAPYGAGFICFSHINPATMFTSYVTQVEGSSFIELNDLMEDAPLTWNYNTSPIGEDDSVYWNDVVDTTLNLAFVSGASPITCVASDQNNGVLAQADIYPPGIGSVWGPSMSWGTSVWGGLQYGITPYSVFWTQPLIFSKMVFQAMGYSSLGFKISNIRFVVQPVMYYNVPQATTSNFVPLAFFTWDDFIWDTVNIVWE